MLLDVSRAKEEKRFGDGMKGHMQQHPQRSEGAAETQAENHDPEMIDTRIRQEPPETPLNQYERNRHSNRQESEKDEELRSELRTQALGREHIETDEAVKSAIEYRRSQHRSHRNGGFAIRVRFPGVHWRDTRLGAVAEQNENERDPHGRLVELRCIFHQDRPVQTGNRIGSHNRVSRVVSQNRAE